MIGGTVIKTKLDGNRIWVNCEENESTFQCAIMVMRDKESEQVKPGDELWWQSGSAYWTPFDHSRRDVPLFKIGFSGVMEP